MSRHQNTYELAADVELREISGSLRMLAEQIDRVTGTRADLRACHIHEVLEHAIKHVLRLGLERDREIRDIDHTLFAERRAKLRALESMGVAA